MLIGLPKEIKTREYRGAMVPAGVRELVGRKHEVVVETGAGEGIGCADADYEAAAALGLEYCPPDGAIAA